MTARRYLLLAGLVLSTVVAGCSDDRVGCCCARRGDTSGYWSCGPQTKNSCRKLQVGVGAQWEWSGQRCTHGARREPPAGGLAAIGF